MGGGDREPPGSRLKNGLSTRTRKVQKPGEKVHGVGVVNSVQSSKKSQEDKNRSVHWIYQKEAIDLGKGRFREKAGKRESVMME